MKTLFALFLTLSFVAVMTGRAQGPNSPEQLDQLVAPIALYPDPLVALVLPASTAPSDLTAAANYIAANGDPAGIDAQPWAPSVKGLSHYPTVVTWMAQNMAWTQSLGAAFAQQPADVMKSIQQLRAQAMAAGTLKSSPQETVDVEGDNIRIIPAQTDQIYVPQYDPDVVYAPPPGYDQPYFTYGIGYPVGPWLGFECNWDDFGIWFGPWAPGWGYHREYWRGGGAWHSWRPDPARARMLVRNYGHPGEDFPRPGRFGGGPEAWHGAPVDRGRFYAAPSRGPSVDFRGRAEMGGAPRAAAPQGSFFGGYGRGTQTREYSNRGQQSRQAPVHSAPSRGPSGGGERRR